MSKDIAGEALGRGIFSVKQHQNLSRTVKLIAASAA
jgi:hypothetical protein